MSECIVHRDLLQFVARQLAKWPAAGRQDNPPHFLMPPGAQCLKDSAVLAINRQHLHAALSGQPHHLLSRHDEGFFVR